VGVLATDQSLRPSPEPPASVAGASNEQSAATGNADADLGGSALPTDRSAAVSASEPPRTSGAAPLPAQQVAGQIVAAAHAIQREEAQPIGTLAAKPVSSSVVKVLRLELQPADLGTITIRMSLRQDGLDIRVEASRSDTAGMLQRDQDSLAKLLTSAGYRIDGLAVMTAPTDGAAAPDGRSQTFLPSSTPQHGGSSQPDSRSSGGRPNAEPDPRTSRGNQNDDSSDKSRVARGAGGDLYV
jgi:flagellar hook-length control protein FliK